MEKAAEKVAERVAEAERERRETQFPMLRSLASPAARVAPMLFALTSTKSAVIGAICFE